MQKREPVSVLLLSIFTLGIYGIYWHVMTKKEMNSIGASIPTAWLIIVPIVNIWWAWKYAEGVAFVTKNRYTHFISFVLMVFLSSFANPIFQSAFNDVPAKSTKK